MFTVQIQIFTAYLLNITNRRKERYKKKSSLGCETGMLLTAVRRQAFDKSKLGGCSQSVTEKKIYSIIGLPQEKKKIANKQSNMAP